MSLQEEIIKMKAELANQEMVEEEVIEEVQEEIPAEEEAPKEEEKVEEILEEKEAEKKPIEELDNAGYARLRREAAAEKRLAEAEKRRADQLQRELEEIRKVKDQPIEEADLGISQEFKAVVEDHRANKAEREFAILENRVKQQYPEYGAIAAEYAAAMYQSIRVQNPRKSEYELNEMTKHAILLQAGQYACDGHENPVEEMFHVAREMGFTGKSMQKQEEKPKEEKLQPDMRKVAENRKRSTGMTGSNGRAEGLMTVAAATTLTTAEWGKLPVTERRRLMYGQ